MARRRLPISDTKNKQGCKTTIDGIEYEYSVSNSNQVTITGITAPMFSTVAIPDEIQHMKVVRIEAEAFQDPVGTSVDAWACRVTFDEKRILFDTIILPNSITEMQKQMFMHASVKKIVVPENITVIPEEWAFDSYVHEVEFKNPQKIQVVKSRAFFGCYLTHITWPSGCTEIPAECFSFSGIEHIEGLENVTHIGESAFSDTKLEQIIWPSKCCKIPERCFLRCHRLDSITNIHNVEDIGSLAFAETKISKFIWPSKCKSIRSACFRDSALEEITGIENVESIGRMAFSGTNINKFVIPANCTSFHLRSFARSPVKLIKCSSEQCVIYLSRTSPALDIDIKECLLVKILHAYPSECREKLNASLQNINFIQGFETEIVFEFIMEHDDDLNLTF